MLKKSAGVTLLATSAIMLLAFGPNDHAFTLMSKSFRDGAVLDTKYAGNVATNPNCVGKNISPSLSWSNVPEGTRSFAIVMSDPEGRNGGGVTHWVAYGIRPDVSSFAEGVLSTTPSTFTGGKSTLGLDHYMGPCTPPNRSYHHYGLVLIATDVEPDALPPGLTREELMAKLEGHEKGAAGIVARFRHP